MIIASMKGVLGMFISICGYAATVAPLLIVITILTLLFIGFTMWCDKNI